MLVCFGNEDLIFLAVDSANRWAVVSTTIKLRIEKRQVILLANRLSVFIP